MYPRNVLLVTAVVAAAACGGRDPVIASSPPSITVAASQPRAIVPIAPQLDPAIAAHLAANNGRFEIEDPPADLKVSAARAIEIVVSQAQGPIRKAEALYGTLHYNFGAVTAPRGWFVLLVGPGIAGLPTSSPPTPAAASQARALNLFYVWAFVDGDGGSVMLRNGSGPPP